ncbi:MAG TPA: cytochrome c oxidase subunit 3 [Rhodocyclaceae bacterium]|nr:cytochrome c oxidase subunit 3 [Rhodocyclaceae bacterium]
MNGQVSPQFSSLGQQNAAATLGMWVFLATELMFFGPLFFGDWYGRLHFPLEFAAASRHTDMVLGTANTAILLTSSFAMANAVEALAAGRRTTARAMLVATAVLGVAFLAVKGLEWRHDWQGHLFPGRGSFLANGGQLFFLLYFALTGLHAVHLAIGIVLVLAFALAMRHDTSALAEPGRLRVAGLYWHFVDVVWIFLYPILYLVGRAAG